MGGYLTKSAILGADDLPTADVEMPEWPDKDGDPGLVRVRGLTGTERDRFEFQMAAARERPDQVAVRASIVGRCLIDEDGNRLFTDKELDRLGGKSGTALDRLFEIVRRLSGMLTEAAEEAAEDFGDAPTDGSFSG